jgi:hypothetical protein
VLLDRAVERPPDGSAPDHAHDRLFDGLLNCAIDPGCVRDALRAPCPSSEQARDRRLRFLRRGIVDRPSLAQMSISEHK